MRPAATAAPARPQRIGARVAEVRLDCHVVDEQEEEDEIEAGEHDQPHGARAGIRRAFLHELADTAGLGSEEKQPRQEGRRVERERRSRSSRRRTRRSPTRRPAGCRLRTRAGTPGMNTRFAIHSTSCPNAARRDGSPDIEARMPKNCIISPPPTQITAMVMCVKRRSSNQDMTEMASRARDRGACRRRRSRSTRRSSRRRRSRTRRSRSRGATHSASASISTLRAKYERPNVMITSGSVRMARIGFRIALPTIRMNAPKQERSPAADLHTVEHPVDDDQRENVDAPEDEEADDPKHRSMSL